MGMDTEAPYGNSKGLFCYLDDMCKYQGSANETKKTTPAQYW